MFILKSVNTLVTPHPLLSKSYLPRFLENSKKLVGTERLPSKISGCILWSGLYKEKRKDIFYINHDHFG